jgi:MATE family multidrug resistance protein
MSRLLPEARQTLLLALPMVIGQVCGQLLQVVDLAMVGRVGVLPLAAGMFGNTVFTLFWLFGIGPITAVTILAGEAHGAGDDRRARTVVRHGLVVVGFFALLISSLLGALVMWTEFWHLGQPADVVAEAKPYLFYLGASMLPLLLFIVFKAYSEARGWPWLPLWFNIGAIFLNIFLNWIFIFGNLGAPAMGLTGAGLATLLARVIALIAFWAYLHRSAKTTLRWAWPEWLRVDGRLCFDLIRLGVPIGLQIVFEVGAFSCALFMMGWLPDGAIALAAHAIALNFASLAFMVPLGVMFAASIRVSQARGAGEFHRARTIGWSTLHVAVVFMSAVAVVYALGRHHLPYLFLDDTVGAEAPAVLALASTLMLFAAGFAVFDGIQVTAIGVLRGYRDVRFATLVTFVAFWLLCLPAGFYLGFKLDGTDAVPLPLQAVIEVLPVGAGQGWGAPGVWAGLVLGLFVVAVVLAVRFIFVARRAISGSPSPE